MLEEELFATHTQQDKVVLTGTLSELAHSLVRTSLVHWLVRMLLVAFYISTRVIYDLSKRKQKSTCT